MAGAAKNCRHEGKVFLPAVVDTLSGWHQGADQQMKKFAGAKARHTGQEEEDAQCHALPPIFSNNEGKCSNYQKLYF